jgi:hypothetical protein
MGDPMNHKLLSFLGKAFNDQSGQTLPWLTVAFIAMMAVSGLALDIGHAYVVQSQLQNATNAAAMRGAAALPSGSTTTAEAQAKLVADPIGLSVTTSTYFACVTVTASSSSANLVGSCSSSPSGNNAIKVTKSTTVPTFFLKVLNVLGANLSTIPVSTVATASMRGAITSAWNIAVVLDTTASMATRDSGTQCSGTQISCALQGLQTLLQNVDPCSPSLTTCGSVSTAISTNNVPTSSVVNSVDRVSLFVFPAVTTGTVAQDYNCSNTNPTSGAYNVDETTTVNGMSSGALPTGYTYQVVGFSSDYRTSDVKITQAIPAGLNTASDLVIAAGGTSGCEGLGAPGGQKTYYAQVIYAAQAALYNEQQLPGNTNSQNAMIILTDGNANAPQASGSTPEGGLTSTTPTLNGTGSNHSYTYPSLLGQCGQAIVAAKAAAAAGTRIYTVGYGSPNSSSSNNCGTDRTYSAYPGISPCTTLQDMASSSDDFYSDHAQGCASPNQANITKLTQIFQAIATDLSLAQLIPSTTTATWTPGP